MAVCTPGEMRSRKAPPENRPSDTHSAHARTHVVTHRLPHGRAGAGEHGNRLVHVPTHGKGWSDEHPGRAGRTSFCP